jgi:hypothetical protein
VSKPQKENVVRVPDLNWPVDLFTDVIMPMPQTIMVLSAAAPATPTSWPEMADSWIGNSAQSDVQWRVPMFGSEQIGL